MSLETKVMEEYDKLSEDQKTRPFSNGTEFMWWYESNCGRCCKANPENKPFKKKCDIEIALGLGTITGDCATKYAERAGLMPGHRYRACREFEAEDKSPRKERRTDIKPLPGQMGLLEGKEEL